MTPEEEAWLDEHELNMCSSMYRLVAMMLAAPWTAEKYGGMDYIFGVLEGAVSLGNELHPDG
jgi:hypothetical protein